MEFDIYQSSKSKMIFVFVSSGVDPLSVLPRKYKVHVGQLSMFKRNKTINENDPIIGASPKELINNVTSLGYHIQGVEIKTNISEAGAALGGGLLLASLGGGPIGAVIGAAMGYFLAHNAKEKEDDS